MNVKESTTAGIPGGPRGLRPGGRRLLTGSRRRLVACEFVKLRHLRVGLTSVLLAVAAIALTIVSAVTTPLFADPVTRSWEPLLAGLSLAIPLTSPLLIAVIASRLVDAEHQGNGWLLAQTAGTTPGALCRAKLVALAVPVTAATAAAVFGPMVFGFVVGIDRSPSPAVWWEYLACVVVVNLVVLALHIVLAARIENQLVGLGIGVVGTVLAVFASGLPVAVRHLTPWGYYSLATVADYRNGVLVPTDPFHFSIAALGVGATVSLILVTSRFDSREA